MNHFEIKKTLISCHEHNEEQRANEIAERVRGGEAIAFVSDAGMPGCSDPGSRLDACIRWQCERGAWTIQDQAK